MAQRILEPLRKIPQQIHNFGIIQRIHDFATGRIDDAFNNCLSSSYGCFDSPTAVTFDNVLGLLAVGTKNGSIKIYGAPGVAFTLPSGESTVVGLEFCLGEGRLVVVYADGFIELHELVVKTGSWICRSRLLVVPPDQESITCLALGENVVYVGSSVGTLRQVARDENRLCLGDDVLTSCTASMIVESVPLERRTEVHVDSPIVSLGMQPEGNHLLIAYASGCVAVAIPQPRPDAVTVELPATEVAPTAEVETTTPNTEENPVNAAVDFAPTVVNSDVAADVQPSNSNECGPSSVTETPVKASCEKRATLKLKELARSLRGTESAKPEIEVDVKIAAPPAPRISHLFIRDQAVESAAWRVTAVGTLSTEVVIAYADGAFQIWPVVAAASQQPSESIIVSKRDPPSTPYGPLPCGAIKKILINPGEHGGVLTAFAGGLPRPEFQDRHAVTVMQGQEHHVCYQFGSQVKDFLFIAKRGALNMESGCYRYPSFAAATLLVLTEHELLAIDLMRPDWPALQLPYLNCLNISPVTAVAHVTQVPSSFIDSIRPEEDPIWGGYDSQSKDNNHSDIAILGHANGWITMFIISKGDCAYRIGTLHTASMFAMDDSLNGQKCFDEETWPPFRRVGYCALMYGQCTTEPDPRLAVTLIKAHIEVAHDSATTGASTINILVAGAGGHVTLWTADLDTHSSKRNPVAFEPDVARIQANLIDAATATTTNYVWKGPSSLKPFEGVTQLCDCDGIVFTPRALIQLDPPAPVTSVACEYQWNLLAIGSAHGFAIIDLLRKSTIHTQLLYDKPLQQKITHAVSTVQRELVNRGKQFTASMRQSFRRLKQLRTSSFSPSKGSETPAEVHSGPQPTKDTEASGDQKIDTNTQQTSHTESAANVPPVEESGVSETVTEEDCTQKQKSEVIEEGTSPAAEYVETVTLISEEGPSTVRSFLFADTFLVSSTSPDASSHTIDSMRTPSLWIGTANGRAIAYALQWDGNQGPVKVQLIKELQLRHQAPIIDLCVIDTASRSPVSSSRKRNSSEPITTENIAITEKSPPETAGDIAVSSPSDSVANSDRITEMHQLLVCSEEQVKIFSLPTLRALHKYKFVDRIRLPYGTGHITLTPDTLVTKPEKEAGAAPDSQVNGNVDEEENKTLTNSHHHRKALVAVGVQCFSRGTPDERKNDWVVVAVRRDGKGSILSLPHLRQLFKIQACVSVPTNPVLCVPSFSNTNLILWHIGNQLLVQELSVVPRLLSPVSCISNRGAPQVTIALPEWARPGISSEIIEETTNTDLVNAQCTAETVEEFADNVIEPVINAEKAVRDDQPARESDEKDVNLKTCHPVLSGAPHAGDLTIDSIKEYLNDDDTVTVKTFESSTEKHTLVESGRIVTTVHETEKVDGKVIKDDLVKFTSDGENATPMITDSN